MMNLRRRFVNLVAENKTSGVFSLHRLDVSDHLFYPSTTEAEAAKPAVFRLSLPAPTYNFRPAVVRRTVDKHLFGLANPGISESRILWRSQEGNTFLFDADSHTAWSMPSGLGYYAKRPIIFSAPVAGEQEQEDLFVMCSHTGYRSFQALRFDHSKSKPKPFNSRTFTEWHRLPPPPLSDGSNIYSHAVLDGGRVIAVSADDPSDGTFLFDTVRREWMQRATSDWQMPFFGAPQYVPDLKLWLGVSWSGDDEDDRHHLCASPDLGATVAAARGVRRRPPSVTVKHHWKKGGLETPVGWDTTWAGLIDLGDGGCRFCVAKIVYQMPTSEYPEYDYSAGKTAAVLTGVELVRGAGFRSSSSSSNSNPSSSSSWEGDGFKMVVHKSLRYVFCQHRIECVL